jgi:hypothetical protein
MKRLSMMRRVRGYIWLSAGPWVSGFGAKDTFCSTLPDTPIGMDAAR